MNQHYIINNNITFESKRYRLVINNKEITLSQKETELLEMLCISSLAVVERNQLLQSIWGSSESADIGLNKNILMLRRKFESIGINNAIKTIPRIGYMLLLEVKNIKDEDIHQAISIDESEHLTLVGEQPAMDNILISKRESITPYIRISKKYIFILRYWYSASPRYTFSSLIIQTAFSKHHWMISICIPTTPFHFF
ncbi:winged helix-turn-helix domain-containing protein [Aeromonas hydrophila]|uniref:winged helix-turn-helix domain-containing protein n=1 Tax=Aeromonas hydrophila TaxID=644 RepID=UPI003EC779C6